MSKVVEIVATCQWRISRHIVGTVDMEANKGVIKVRAVNSEPTEQVAVAVADGLGREEGLRELRAVIHADVRMRVVQEIESKIALTNAYHAANTGVGTVEVKWFIKRDVVT